MPWYFFPCSFSPWSFSPVTQTLPEWSSKILTTSRLPSANSVPETAESGANRPWLPSSGADLSRSRRQRPILKSNARALMEPGRHSLRSAKLLRRKRHPIEIEAPHAALRGGPYLSVCVFEYGSEFRTFPRKLGALSPCFTDFAEPVERTSSRHKDRVRTERRSTHIEHRLTSGKHRDHGVVD